MEPPAIHTEGMTEMVAGGALKDAPPLTVGEPIASEGITESTILDLISGAIEVQSLISPRSGVWLC